MNGNVGVGTTEPEAKLDVRGQINANNAIELSGSANAVKTIYLSSYPDAAANWNYIRSANDYLNIVSSGARHIVLSPGGNVGIGTTGPQAKLDVAGAIKIGSQDTCDANTVGAIRYVPTQYEERFEGCNGESWQLIKSVATVPWACGDNVTFTYKASSVTYGTVSHNGKCWMDRNLGASQSQVATAYNDSAAYGDLFQWGRLDDGHQTRTSATTSNLSSTDNPGHSNFILAPDSPYDWRSPQNNNLWQGVTGTNNPCPSGWRIPTETELDNERLNWSSQDYNGAFASPLKLTAGGYRLYSNGSLSSVGSYGFYWSSTVSGTNARSLYFRSTDAGMYGGSRANGFSVRCVQD